ncbi:prepilin peptidase [Microbacterium sp. P01]|uniref:prepilin peptidase n=1 Tax=unclassified Microbacterium TaxID=2609290 RepID=UPI0036710F8E
MSPIDAHPGAIVATVLAFLLLAVVSVVLTVIDLREHRLPNRIVLPLYPAVLALLAIACVFGSPWTWLLRAAVSGATLFVFYALMRGVSGRGVGGGDVKLAGVIGLYLGWVGWGALVVGTVSGFLIGGAVAVALLAARRANRSTAIPFGPCLLAGAWVGILVGETPAAAYLGL